MAAVEETLRSEFGLRLSEAQLDAIRDETFRRFRGELQPMPGIVEALGRLEVRRCVASSSSLERIRLSLDLTGLLEMLEPHIYSASMVTRGKPAPDLFLHAAKGMGVRPQDCIVVEDSPAGIEAARQAGMRVLAFTGGSHAGHAGLETTLAGIPLVPPGRPLALPTRCKEIQCPSSRRLIRPGDWPFNGCWK